MSNSHGLDDDVLLSAIAAGDERALGALYDRWAPRVYGLAIRVLGDRRRAEDVVHDVFLAVWRDAGDRAARRDGVRAWLTRLSRARCLQRA